MNTIEAVYPLSAVQKAMLLSDTVSANGGVYIDQVSCIILGPLRQAEFQNAWQRIVDRHDALRSAFVWQDVSEPLQAVGRRVRLPFEYHYWQTLSFSEQNSEFLRLMSQQRRLGFKLSRAPLMRITLAQIGENRHKFLWTYHHLVLDGWCLPLIFSELWIIYEALCECKEPALPPAGHFRDYLAWLQRRNLNEAEEYWRGHLKGVTAPLRIGSPESSPVTDSEIADVEVRLDSQLTMRIEALARGVRVTMNTVLQGAWALILHFYSGEEDVVFGATVSGRPSDLCGAETIVGLFINTVPVRARIDSSASLETWLRKFQEQQVAQQKHEHASLSDIQSWSDVPPFLPLFESVLVMQNYPVSVSVLSSHLGIEIAEISGSIRSKHPLTVVIARNGGLVVHLSYRRAVFSDELVHRIANHYDMVLQAMVTNPTGHIGALGLPGNHRKEWGNYNRSLSTPAAETLWAHQQFERHVQARPDAPAVFYREAVWTYKTLNRLSNQLARRIRTFGVGLEVPVGVYLEPSPELVVSFLAILKSGGVYVPFDTNFSLGRLEALIEAIQPAVVVTLKLDAANLPTGETRVLCLDLEAAMLACGGEEDLETEMTAENSAYTMYSSGREWGLRGVVATQAGLRNLASAQRVEFEGIGEGDRFPLIARPHSVMSIFEITGSLMQGAAICIPPPGAIPDTSVAEFLEAAEITTAVLSPSVLARLSGHRGLNHLSRLLLSGEVPRAPLLERLSGGRRIYNVYGNKETTGFALAAEWKPSRTAMEIGRPVTNCEAYVLDNQMRPAPVGTSVELYIGGESLARGYHARPALTAERFVPDPFSGRAGARLYRTGDLARYQQDGKIECLGKIDDQAKICGFRLELSVLEEALLARPDVQDAAVVVSRKAPYSNHLSVHVVPQEGHEWTIEKWAECLAAKLPHAMPPIFNVIAAMPRTRSGNIDRNALSCAVPSSLRMEAPHDSPVEQVVLSICRKLLRLPTIDRGSNLLTAGASSLIALQLLSRVRDALGINLTLGQLFDSPTPAGLAAKLIEAMRKPISASYPPISRAPRDNLMLSSLAQERIWFSQKLQHGAAFNIPVAVEMVGNLSRRLLPLVFAHIVQRHESLRTAFIDARGIPMQAISSACEVPVPVVDLEGLTDIHAERILRAMRSHEAEQVFDLAIPPLIRLRLVKLNHLRHVLLLTMHHIIGDLWSFTVLFRDFCLLYNTLLLDASSSVPSLDLQYADVALWERSLLENGAFQPQLAFWERKLARAKPLRLSMRDLNSSAHRPGRGALHSFEISGEISEKVTTMARTEQVTLFMFLLAVFKIVLCHFAATDDVIVGTNVSGRNHTHAEPLIGCFVNQLLLRTDLSGDPGFRGVLARVRTTTLEAYSNQEAPFERVASILNRESCHLDGNPIPILFNLQNIPSPPPVASGMTLKPLRWDIQASRLDLAYFVEDNGASLMVYCTYNPSLYEHNTILDISAAYDIVLQTVCSEPDATVNTLCKVIDRNALARTRSMRPTNAFKARRRPIISSSEDLVIIRPISSGATLPIVVEARFTDVSLSEWAASMKDTLENLLLKHGAVLFRGFAVRTTEEFEQCATAISPALFGDYGDLPRQEAGGKVYGSTSYPSDKAILFHNESSHLKQWPSRIWFYCAIAPERGGETPIVDCRILLHRLDAEIVRDLRARRLMYKRTFSSNLDVNWQTFFGTTDQNEVEKRCRESGTRFAWTSDGLSTAGNGPAIARHPKTGEYVFFNQILLHHPSMLQPAVREALQMLYRQEDLPRNVCYGDGSPIEDEVVHRIRAAYDSVSTRFAWRKHDVLMLDNMLVAHGRNPFWGQRKILVAMADMIEEKALPPA